MLLFIALLLPFIQADLFKYLSKNEIEDIFARLPPQSNIYNPFSNITTQCGHKSYQYVNAEVENQSITVRTRQPNISCANSTNKNTLLSLTLVDFLQYQLNNQTNETLQWHLEGCQDVDSRDNEQATFINFGGEIFRLSLEQNNASTIYTFTYSCHSPGDAFILFRQDQNGANFNFTLQDVENLMQLQESQTKPQNSHVAHRSTAYIWVLVAIFLFAGVVLSLIFYKYCQNDDSEEQIEMVGRSRIEDPL